MLQTAYAPRLRGDLREWWSAYQNRRQSRALNQQVTAFSEPASKIVWDENPDTAATLRSASGYGRIRVELSAQHTFLARWPFGARAIIPAAVNQWHLQNFRFAFPNQGGRVVVEPDECALVLLHGFKRPSGEYRLVYVYVQGKILARNPEFPDRRDMPPLDRQWSSKVNKELVLVAASCTTDADGHATCLESDVTTFNIYPPDNRQELDFTWIPPSGGRPEQIRLDSRGKLRFYAGQPDPASRSQFTIGYDVDQQHGTIHGQVMSDGTVQFKPDTGLTVGNRWYPAGSPPPTQQ
jgi:hypothetical protein